MRKYLHINLRDRSVHTKNCTARRSSASAGTSSPRPCSDSERPKVDPLDPENPLIFSAGPFAGTNFSNANRISVGCKSPLTGGIKEANSGGTFGFALGQLETAGLTLYGTASEWWWSVSPRTAAVTYESAAPYMARATTRRPH